MTVAHIYFYALLGCVALMGVGLLTATPALAVMGGSVLTIVTIAYLTAWALEGFF